MTEEQIKTNQINARLEQWFDHPLRKFERFAYAESNNSFKFPEGFTQERFMSHSTSHADEVLYVTFTHSGRVWGYSVRWDAYQRGGGKYYFRSSSVGKDNAYCFSKYNYRSKYSKKPGEIIRYMDNDVQRVMERIEIDEKQKAAAKARVEQVKMAWESTGFEANKISDTSFSLVLDVKRNDNSYYETGKKIDILEEGGKFKVKTIYGEFTKEQVEAIAQILKTAEPTKFTYF